jgi:hypothetical protein
MARQGTTDQGLGDEIAFGTARRAAHDSSLSDAHLVLCCQLAVYVHIATLRLVFALFSQINHYLNEASIERRVDNTSECRSDPRVVGSWAAVKSKRPMTFARKAHCGSDTRTCLCFVFANQSFE